MVLGEGVGRDRSAILVGEGFGEWDERATGQITGTTRPQDEASQTRPHGHASGKQRWGWQNRTASVSPIIRLLLRNGIGPPPHRGGASRRGRALLLMLFSLRFIFSGVLVGVAHLGGIYMRHEDQLAIHGCESLYLIHSGAFSRAISVLGLSLFWTRG